MPNRYIYIDFLRALGLILLIGVHVASPQWYVVFRSFDVPLMVFVSALCYSVADSNKNTWSFCREYKNYVLKRIKRICFPVWIFLTIFFGIFFIYSIINDQNFFRYSQIAGSYLLLNSPSIGYVWIMRVLIMMAIIIPALYKWLHNIPFIGLILLIFGILGFQEIMIPIVHDIDTHWVKFCIDETLLYIIGYSSITILGLKIKTLSFAQIVTILGISIALIFILVHKGIEFNPQIYKYPPHSIYCLYGLTVSSGLWLLRNKLEIYVTQRFWSYLSEKSMWIYLWHIVPVYFMSSYMDIPGFWLGRYIIVFFIAILLNIIWDSICKRLS